MRCSRPFSQGASVSILTVSASSPTACLPASLSGSPPFMPGHLSAVAVSQASLSNVAV
jgi:hypothetical protein